MSGRPHFAQRQGGEAQREVTVVARAHVPAAVSSPLAPARAGAPWRSPSVIRPGEISRARTSLDGLFSVRKLHRAGRIRRFAGSGARRLTPPHPTYIAKECARRRGRRCRLSRLRSSAGGPRQVPVVVADGPPASCECGWAVARGDSRFAGRKCSTSSRLCAASTDLLRLSPDRTRGRAADSGSSMPSSRERATGTSVCA